MGNELQVAADADIREQAAQHTLAANPLIGVRGADILDSARVLAGQIVSNPIAATKEYLGLLTELGRIAIGASELAPDAKDRRFADPAWKESVAYRALAQSYLAWANALNRFLDQAKLDKRDAERARFVVSLIVDALAPTNSFAGNPAVLKKLVDTGGASFLHGLENFFGDLVANGGLPAQVDRRGFAVGKNLVTTPGSVVYRTPVMELIQYQPMTDEVHARPLLIAPPQINKFYVFDLVPEKSIAQYCLKGNLQTFAISWKNPTAAERDFGIDTYVAALEQAVDVMRDITGSADVNLAGACSGAMTLAALLGHLAAKGDARVHSATMMVVLLDSSEESQLGLFVTPETIAAAKHASAAAGLLSGKTMGRMFAWMRPNDLVWSYWVNNYLLGKDPPAFDILYWNNDTTRLPARFHGQLLDLFSESLLRRPGTFEVLGTPIDLAKVTCDKYVVAGASDHITPWQGGWRAARLFGGNAEFVLSGSGHIQSIVNPPGNAKARYFINPESAADPKQWLAAATGKPGSWWEHWQAWLTARSGEVVPAPASLGSSRHPPLAPSPGTYVLAP